MKNQKSLTNKGFSLVELIIVVAIMAVLIGVLAPQYLRYVEKSRLQKDNTSIAEVADVIKMMSAEETLVTKIPEAGITFNFTQNASTNTWELSGCSVADINEEMLETINGTNSGGTYVFDVTLSSNTYKNADDKPSITAKVDDNNVMTVTCSNWYETVPKAEEAGTTKTF